MEEEWATLEVWEVKPVRTLTLVCHFALLFPSFEGPNTWLHILAPAVTLVCQGTKGI